MTPIRPWDLLQVADPGHHLLPEVKQQILGTVKFSLGDTILKVKALRILLSGFAHNSKITFILCVFIIVVHERFYRKKLAFETELKPYFCSNKMT